MVENSVLDIYLLSLIDRGLPTAYGMKQVGGVSIGSSSPALRRLEAAKLIRRLPSSATSRRPRHEFALTALGRKTVRQRWKLLLGSHTALDFDSTLRVADMAKHYGARTIEVASLLQAAAATRVEGLARVRAQSVQSADETAAATWQHRWTALEVKAEAKFLARLAATVQDLGSKPSQSRPKPPTAKR